VIAGEPHATGELFERVDCGLTAAIFSEDPAEHEAFLPQFMREQSRTVMRQLSAGG
jgi:hypothetical protein